jgi:hypothetical protein
VKVGCCNRIIDRVWVKKMVIKDVRDVSYKRMRGPQHRYGKWIRVDNNYNV